MSQFAIHQDVENQVSRRGKAANTRGNGQKRAVLGVITNQVNQNIRVQPARAAKPKVRSSQVFFSPNFRPKAKIKPVLLF